MYGVMPTAIGPVVEAPNLDTPEERQRRSRVAARVGEIAVTVGEVEDHLAGASRGVVDAYRAGHGRHEVVQHLLRQHLLAAEAERRGTVDAATRFAAGRREERALRELLELEVRRDPGAIPPPSPPVEVPETRFGVILRGTRAVVEAWARDHHDTGYLEALARGNEVGTAQETPFGPREEPPQTTPSIEPAVWSALFTLDHIGAMSRPIPIGSGQFAVVMEAGLTQGFTDMGPDEGARRMLAADRAWQELVAQVRSDRVTNLDLGVLDGVAFRSAAGRSAEDIQRLADQLAAERARAAMAEAAAQEAAEPTPPRQP